MMKFKKFLCMFLAVLMILIACFASFASYAEESGEEYLAEEVVTEAAPEIAAEEPVVEETPAETYAPVEETAPTYEETVPEEITSTYEETVPETAAETTPAATEEAATPEENTTQEEQALDPATAPATDPAQPADDTTPQTEPQQETTPEATTSNEAEETTTEAAPAEEPMTVLEEQTEETTTSGLSWQTLNVVPKDEVIDDIDHPSALWYWVERSWNRHFYRTVSAEKKAVETRIEISGMLPDNASATANVIELLEDDTYNIMGLYAYVITIYDAQGKEFVPAEDQPVTIRIRTGEITQALQDGRTIWVFTYTNNATEGQWEYGSVTEWDNVYFETKMNPLYLFVCSYDEFYVPSEETTTEEVTTAEETTADPEIIYQTDPEEETTAEEETEVETEEETTPEGPVIEDDKIIYADDNIYLTGSMPADGIVEATPVDVQIEGQVVLAAYDIAIYADKEQREEGITWQPEEDTVQIHIVDPELSRINNDEVSVFGMENVDAEAELANTAQIEEEEVIVDAGKSSIVVIAQQLLEKTITIGGATYKVMVTYDTAAGIPEGAELSVADVSEDSTENYLEQAADVLGWQEEDSIFYSLVLDIRILYEGEEIQPLTPVTVSVELLDIEDADVTAVEATQALEVVHFHEDEEGARVQSLDTVVSAAGTSCDISFETEGFSKFVIAGAYRNVLTSSTDLAEVSVQTLNKNLSLEMETIEAEEDILVKGQELLESYVISQEDGSIQNTGSVRANVTLDENVSLDELESVNVYSIKDGALEEIISDDMEPGTKVTVSLNGIDGFALVKDTGLRELTLVAEPAIGESILLEGMVPVEAELQAAAVEELPELQDAAKEEPADAEADETFLCAYDISIINSGEKFQPKEGETIRVEITNDAIGQATEAGRRLHIWHITDDGEREEITEFAVQGSTVRFEAKGFSAYAIVDGPAPLDTIERHATSLEELVTSGFYLSIISNDTLNYGVRFWMTDYMTANNRLVERTTLGESAAGVYYFEKVDNTESDYYVYCIKDDTKYYLSISTPTYAKLDTVQKTQFTVSLVSGVTERFYISCKFNNTTYYLNLRNKANVNDQGFGCSTYSTQGSHVILSYPTDMSDDPFELDGKPYGLMNWLEGVSGRAMMANAISSSALEAKTLTVMTRSDNNEDKIFVPKADEITFWTFEWVEQDRYYLKAHNNGSEQYLRIASNGLSLVDVPDDNCKLQVIPGTGVHAGQISLRTGNAILTYTGKLDTGFTVGGSAGSEYLYLVDESELTEDYFLIYSASKVSVSSVDNGAKVIVYTRSWNDQLKKYEFYAVDHDGTLVRVFESGDSIQWVGRRLNSMLWDFVEYYWEGTDDPNYFYELYNEFSEEYLAPQISGGQILSDETIGINLNGRRNSAYFSSILAWDQDNYGYAGLKVENGHLVSCPGKDALDFYFAIVQDIPVDDVLHGNVQTVDNDLYGITMRMKNFGTAAEMNSFLGSSAGGMGTKLTQGLLSTNLINGYPTVTKNTNYLGELYSGAQLVNHLFIASTYFSSGYYEFDSSQNFAALDRASGWFNVFEELGSYDSGGDKWSLKHGQFFPYNTINAGVYAAVNGKNLYTVDGELLPDSDPRKNERLYLIKNVDCYFGVEIEASFTQTPNGLDAWGHDIIYEFTGDDDFWLYVDDELVIDLGGIHSAVPGSVNYATGEVFVNGLPTTLYDTFRANYEARGVSDIDQKLAEIFEQKTGPSGTYYTFKENTQHTMKIFYMERGAGASNLHMRFNLASVQPGHVQLSKELSGVDERESQFVEFPYQIFYKTSDEAQEQPLIDTPEDIHVRYKDTDKEVPFRSSITIDGIEYQNVYLLKPGEVADIRIPGDSVHYTSKYRIVECGVNTSVFSEVKVNEEVIQGTAAEGSENRKDFGIDLASPSERSRVNYENTVNPEALGKLSFTKNLFKPDEEYRPISHDEDPQTFSFRLYLAAELDENLDLTNMQTYHVKDESGYYCIWDVTTKSFVRHPDNITDYDSVQDEETKNALTFQTSIYGSVSSIPNGYTVEVRGLLPGTRYKVEERPSDNPDGYSFWRYEQKDDNGDYQVANGVEAEDGISDIIEIGTDAGLKIDNLKGFGLRVYKTWSDTEYMQRRDPAYFAVYAKHNDSEYYLIDGSVQQMLYGADTLYWYYETLPDSNAGGIDDYCIREVSLTNPSVDNLGHVSYDTIERIDENGSVAIKGCLKGGTEETLVYTVHYGEPKTETRVRIDTAENSRPGIIFKKTEWAGTPLGGAKFILTQDEDSSISFGPFISDETYGLITEAYLVENKNYTLTETEAPVGYYGLQGKLTITMSADGTVTITCEKGEDENNISLATSTMVAIKNRKLVFQVIKKGGENAESALPLADVHFALYKEKTVGGDTAIDIKPMEEYKDLISDTEGIVPKVNETLLAGTYELHEKSVPSGYQSLSLPQIKFTISPSGAVSLNKTIDGVTLSSTDADGMKSYIMEILDHPAANLTIKKIVAGTDGDQQKEFEFRLKQVEKQTNGTMYAWTKYDADNNPIGGTQLGDMPLTTRNEENRFTLTHGQYIVIELPKNKNVVFEEVIDSEDYYDTLWTFGANTPVSGHSMMVKLNDDATLLVTNRKGEVHVAPTGVRTHTTPLLWFLIAGLALLAGVVLPAMIRKKY